MMCLSHVHLKVVPIVCLRFIRGTGIPVKHNSNNLYLKQRTALLDYVSQDIFCFSSVEVHCLV